MPTDVDRSVDEMNCRDQATMDGRQQCAARTATSSRRTTRRAVNVPVVFNGVCESRCLARIPMMQSADSWQGDDRRAAVGWFDVAVHRRVLLEPEVCAIGVVVRDVLFEQAVQVAFSEHDDVLTARLTS
jgi:hypothetical protein